MSAGDSESIFRDRVQRLVLGSAQFGMPYGISNQQGQPQRGEVAAILRAARAEGVSALDTAAAYGVSEQVLSASLPSEWPAKIISKVGIDGRPSTGSQLAGELQESVLRSQAYFSSSGSYQRGLYGLLLHNIHDLDTPGFDQFIDWLVPWAAANGVKLGVSAYRPADVLKAERRLPTELAQIPLNVFDQRFLQDDFLANMKARGIEVLPAVCSCRACC